jgi:2'-5' RNA ligase
MTKRGSLHRLRKRYDDLWSAAIGKIRTGKIESDRVLGAGLMDRRRGLTLIARPSADVRKKVMTFLRELRRLESDQYYYAASDLHLTILSLFGAMTKPARFLVHLEKYVAAVDSVLRQVGPIQIKFAGVTASPGAIMIQGFPDIDALNQIRDTLRHQLRVRGLTGGLDLRYRLETAHMTIARFRARLRDSKHFAAVLEHARHHSFGSTTIKSLSLVTNDWYMRHQTLETVRRYRLIAECGVRNGEKVATRRRS